MRHVKPLLAFLYLSINLSIYERNSIAEHFCWGDIQLLHIKLENLIQIWQCVPI